MPNNAAIRDNQRLREKYNARVRPAGTDKNRLDNSRIEFLFTNKLQRGKKALLTPGFDVAQEIYSLFKKTGVSAKVTARAWGSTGNAMQAVALDAENSAKKLPPGRNFATPAGYIMDEMRSGKEKGKNYIVITDGNIYAGDIKALMLSLAFLELDPRATLNFVVSNAQDETKIDELVKALKDRPAGKQVNLVKVGADNEIAAAVKELIKTHIAQPPAAPKTPAVAAVVQKKPGFWKKLAYRRPAK